MVLDELVTNRSSSASYGAEDLNRVYTAVQYLAAQLLAEGCSLSLSAMPTWTQEDIPTLAQLTGYLQNVREVKEALSATTRLPAAMDRSGYTDWNNLERLLLEAEGLLQNMIAGYVYCGELYSGEEFNGD